MNSWTKAVTYITCVPAYGRDYKSKAEVLADYEAGKDFRVESIGLSGYVSKADKPAGAVLNVRYAKLRKVCVIP